MGRRLDALSVDEQRKYEKAWSTERYRVYSPGEEFFKRAYGDLCAQRGDTLCDWGIGGGQAAAMFKKKGLKVEGIDLARNANMHFDGKVHIGSIWDPPFERERSFTLGYCVDVMEHIPPEKVRDTLRAIKRYTTDACWFSIATFADKEGEYIGETLHLTVRNANYWAAQFGLIFPRFKFNNHGKHIFVTAYKEKI